MISERVTKYVDSLEPWLTPDDGNYNLAKPALTALVLPYDIEPWRSHHTVNHLEEKADFLTQNINALQSPRMVFGASAGHDSVYQPWLYNGALGVSGVNEQQSLNLTRSLLMPLYDTREVEEMSLLIKATAEHPNNAGNTDLAYFLDSDMLILGADEERFDQYENDIFNEFTWLGTVSRRQYLLGRLAFFNTVADRRIFSTEVAQDLYENRAHRNITKMALRHVREIDY